MATCFPDSLPEAVEQLAKQAVLMRKLRQVQKQAFGIDMAQLKDYGNQALDYVKQNPRLAGTLAGAGGGALLGGLSSLGQPEEDRHMGRDALMGGLAGAGAGFGASQLLTQYNAPPTETEQKLKELEAPADKVNQDYAKESPTLAGTVTKDLPVLGAVGAADAGRYAFNRRNYPEDILRGANESPRAGVKATAAKNSPTFAQRFGQIFENMTPERRAEVLAQARGGATVRHGLGATTNELRSFLERGRASRLGISTPEEFYWPHLNAKEIGGRGLLYAGIPLAHYLLRKIQHEAQPML